MVKQQERDYKKGIKIRDLAASFQYWPRIFALLLEIDATRFTLVLLINILNGIAPIATLLATQELINSVMANGNKDFYYVLEVFAVFVFISVIADAISSLKNYYEGLFQPILAYEINIKLMQKAVSLKLVDFENSDTYDKLQRAQNEAGSRPFQVFRSILNLISSTITLISSAIVLVLWKWWVAFLLILIPILSSFYFLKLGQREFLLQWKRASRSRKSWYYSFLMTRDSTYKEVKLYQLGDYLVQKYKKIFERNFKVDSKMLKIRSVTNFTFQMVNQFIGDVIVVFILFSTFKGEIPIGNLVSYIRAVALVEGNSQGVLNIIFSMYQDNLYIKQLFEFLDITTEDTAEKNGRNQEVNTVLDKIQHIEFRNVSFRYPGAEKYALKNISFMIHAGEKVAVVGENGSGKTTMVKLLTCLYEIEEGEILINGRPLQELDREDIRKKIGVVFQDFVRYELRVRENIGFGNVKRLYEDDKLIEAAGYAGIDRTVASFPRELDTQLGHWFADGQQLSGGQWQKVAIARAFIRDADVYILDEPSASLDPIAESDVLDKFFQVTNGKIGIFTSHRYSTVKHADNILVFKEGQIIAQGTHYELIKSNLHYAHLYSIQASPYHDYADENAVKEGYYKISNL